MSKIEKVAGIISENGVTDAEAREINATTGWSYDVSGYTENTWVRLEGVVCDETEMAAALALAKAWGRSDI